MSSFFIPDPEGQVPSAEGYFGAFGGKFIPEALVAAVDEVAVEYDKAKADPAFAAELDDLLVNYTGRPSALTEVPRFAEHAGGRAGLPQAGGPQPHRVPQDQQRARAGPAHQAHGQDPRHRRDRRRQHGVATATACALFGLECTIYMGEIDTQRQALNVARMRMLGAEVIAVKSGSRTLKDAINEAFRDWVANVDRTHYLFGTVAGPHPFPAWCATSTGSSASRPGGRSWSGPGGCPTPPSPASAAAPTPSGSSTPSSRTPDVRLIGCEPAGHGVETGEHAATLTAASPAFCTGRGRTCCRTRRGRSPSRTRFGRLDYPGVGPEHAYLKDTDGPSTARSPTTPRCRRCGCCRAPRASSRRSRARTPWPVPSRSAELGSDGLIVVNLSGRGDKDMDTAARYFGLYDTEAEVAATRPTSPRSRGRRVSSNIRLLADTLAAPRPRAAPRSSPTCPPVSRPSTAGSRP